MPVRAAWDQQSAGRSSPARAAHPSALPPPLRPGGSPMSRGSPGSEPLKETSYVEDIDPRFAEPSVVAPPFIQRLTPPPVIDTNNDSFDSIPEGARSPAESEHSTFTSISQRGINPRWSGNVNPPSAMAPPYQGVPPRRPVPQLNNVLLDNNPDFQLPGNRGGLRGGRGGRGGYAPPF